MIEEDLKNLQTAKLSFIWLISFVNKQQTEIERLKQELEYEALERKNE